jgi:hypothetical protein
MFAIWSLSKVKETSASDGATICGAEGVMKTTLFGTLRMPDDPTKPDPPDSSAPVSETAPPTGNETTPAATNGAASTIPRGFREARPETYGRDYVIGGAASPRRPR